MKTFAGQQIEPLFQFSWLVVFLSLLLCGSIAVVLGFTVDPKLALAVSLSLLALLYLFFGGLPSMFRPRSSLLPVPVGGKYRSPVLTPPSGGVLRRASGGRELDLGVASQHASGPSHRVPGAAAEADVCEPAGAAGAEHQSAACQVTLRLGRRSQGESPSVVMMSQ